MRNEENNAGTIKDLGAALGGPRFPGADSSVEYVPYAVVPENYKLESLEDFLPAPTRKRAHVHLLDAPSFIAYSKKHGSMDKCTIYADLDFEAGLCNLEAVINDHGSDPFDAQWRDHIATFAPKHSVEWKRWNGSNAKQKSQSEFAAFIEENLGDIATVSGMPTGTQMLEMALGFEATSERRFKKKIDLQGGGVALEYIDQADDDTSTRMQLFERFTIGIPVLQGATAAYQARLKFRQNGDRLTFWYELIRADRVFKQAAEDAVNSIREETGFPVLTGNAGTAS